MKEIFVSVSSITFIKIRKCIKIRNLAIINILVNANHLLQ